MLFGLRETLRSEGFLEVVTPVVRRANLGAGRRVPVDLDGGRYLRAMIGPALRVNLEHHRRIFEIGPCFRPEKPDALHANEFTMLDLYAASENFTYLNELAEILVAPHIAYTPVRVSVAVTFALAMAAPVASVTLPLMVLRFSCAKTDAAMATSVQRKRLTWTSSIRPLTEYPLGGDEPCARLTPGTTAVLNRFELIVDGIEVVHGYEDEVDPAAFAERARAADLYDDEQRLAGEAIDDGRVPAASVGLGIGIERLCAAASGIRDIRPFLQSTQF